MKPFSLVGAVIGGVLGALVWAAVTYFFKVEVGYIAWGVGGLVGLGALAMGGRGAATGGACALIALLAIFAGKFLAVKVAVGSPDAEALYRDFVSDARDFAALTSERQFPRFMVQHGYSNAGEPSGVTADEVERFKTKRAPMLREIHEKNLTFKEWRDTAAGKAYLAELKEWESAVDRRIVQAVIDELNVIDLIFALLGVATAYKLVAGAKVEPSNEGRSEPEAPSQA
jgi:hypothetical protein